MPRRHDWEGIERWISTNRPLEVNVATQGSWKYAIANEVEAAFGRDQEANVREGERRERAEQLTNAAAEEGAAAAIRDEEANAREGERRNRAEERFDEFLQAFERVGGIRTAMETIVGDLNEQGLISEVEVQKFPGRVGRVAFCTAAIRFHLQSDASSHGSVEIVASGNHETRLLEIVQSRTTQGITEDSAFLEDLTEDRIGESVLTVVRELLRK
jgi:hypothetical protein